MLNPFRILFVGDLRVQARSLQRKRAFCDLGHHVTALSITTQEGVQKPNPFLIHTTNRVLHKIGFPRAQTPINRSIVSAVQDDSFDLIWIETGNTIHPRTLKVIRREQPSCRLVSYSEDDMYARHCRSLYYTWGLRLYDTVVTTKSYNCNQDELPTLGAKKVLFVDKAHCKYLHAPVALTREDRARFGADVGFVGSYEQSRAASMLHLARNGIPVRIWGNGWDNCMERHENLQIEGQPVYGVDYAKVLCATRINLAFLRKINRDLQTDRTMEIPACGALMLAERTEEHRRLFVENQEAAYFDNDEELLAKVQYFSSNEAMRSEIAAAGRNRCLSSGYSHHDRLASILSQIVVTRPTSQSSQAA